MSVTWHRLDSRLLHAQLLEGWIPVLKPQRVILIPHDRRGRPRSFDMSQRLVPESVQLLWRPLESLTPARELVTQPSTLFVLEQPQTVLQFHRDITPLREVSIGNCDRAEGRREVVRGVWLSESECRMMRELMDDGVSVVIKPTPFSEGIAFEQVTFSR